MGISLKSVQILERKRRNGQGFVSGDATQRRKEKVTGERWKGETEGVKEKEENERRAA